MLSRAAICSAAVSTWPAVEVSTYYKSILQAEALANQLTPYLQLVVSSKGASRLASPTDWIPGDAYYLNS